MNATARTRSASPGHVLLCFQPTIGGVPSYVANLAEGLVNLGWQVSAALPRQTPVYRRLAAVSSHMVPLDTASAPAPVDDLRACRNLISLCRSTGVDLIHAHSSKAGAIASLVGGRAGVPSVYSPHAWSFQRELPGSVERAFRFLEGALARRHAHVIAVSDSERMEAERYGLVSRERIELINTGLEDRVLPSRQAARSRLAVDPDMFVVGWVGRTGPQKQSEHLPLLARALADEATVVALGYGLPDSPAGRQVRELGGTVVSATEPDEIYAAADVLVSTSRWESAPLVVIEAMRASLPVVAYDIAGLREQVDEGVTGHLVSPGDVGGLAYRVLELARDRARTHEMGASGRERFLERFNYPRMIQEIDGAYRRVLGRDGRGSDGRRE
jgi:glycosyltransferase involved in cell wall biosynthesis